MESRVPARRTVAERPVTVEVGQGAAAEAQRTPPPACIVALGPLSDTWLCELLPETLIRKSRFDDYPVGVEHLRFESRSVLDRLPGLESKSGPTLLRSAVDAVLGAGAPSVDVVVGRVIGGRPWDFDDERIFHTLDGYLSAMPGTLLVFPDFGGPVDITGRPRTDHEQRLQRMAQALERFGPTWRERYQIALIDDPRLPPDLMGGFLNRMLGNDVLACRWQGSQDKLAAHGWQSPSAAVIGLLTASNRAILGMVGHSCQVGGARRIAPSRRERLSRRDPAYLDAGHGSLFLNLELDDRADIARVVSEPTFRRPVGSWPFSALRMAKAVHQRLAEAASHFVFRPADPREAMALAAALQHSVRPFVDAGLLVGGDMFPEPVITGSVESYGDGARTLLADVTGSLRPWSLRVSVRVSLRPNENPALEVL